MENITTEQILSNRFNLEKEYDTIKSYLLQKINRMDQIEQEIIKIDEELKLRNK